MKRPGFTNDEKKRMMISQETLDGITMTSKCEHMQTNMHVLLL